MAKQNEIDYPEGLGEAGKLHALNKPFSDALCGRHLYEIGMVFQMLPPAPARLLDLGIGSGWTSAMFAKNGYSVVGQDISPAMIEMAAANKEKWAVSDLELKVQDYEGMRFCEEFDCAVFCDSLHHAVDPELALRKAFEALKPGGIVVTVEPGKGHAASESSRRAIEEFGVTEKDMPPSLIIEMGRRIGFSRFEIFERHVNLPEMYSGSGDDLKLAGRCKVAANLFGKAIHAMWVGAKKSHHKAAGMMSVETLDRPQFVRLRK